MGQKKHGEFFSEMIVGLFMVAVLALLAYFTIIISGVDWLKGGAKVPLLVMFDNVGGLKVRDSVVMRGMPIGSISGLALDQGRVRVSLQVQKDVVVREGYTFQVCNGSLLGGTYLLLEEGTGEVLPPGTVFEGERTYQWMRDLGQVIADLKEATEGGHLKNAVTNLDAAVASIRQTLDRVERGEGTLGKLLSGDEVIYNDLSNTVANLKSVTEKIDSGTNTIGRLLNDNGAAFENLNSMIADLKTVSERLEKSEGTLGKLLSSDDSIYNDIQSAVADLKRLAEGLEKGEGTLGKLLKDDAVYGDLQQTIANLKVVTDRLEKGEGTLGKLSADDKLYDDVHGLIKDVRQTVDNFRDTTPISAFSSLIMGGL